MTRIKKVHKAVRRSYKGKMLTAFALIAAGLGASALGDPTIANLLVMAGLTLGGWTKGLHTPDPGDAYEDASDNDEEQS